jgi:hypothetical protein
MSSAGDPTCSRWINMPGARSPLSMGTRMTLIEEWVQNAATGERKKEGTAKCRALYERL